MKSFSRIIAAFLLLTAGAFGQVHGCLHKPRHVRSSKPQVVRDAKRGEKCWVPKSPDHQLKLDCSRGSCRPVWVRTPKHTVAK
jgi:hypothetical protein